MVPPVAGYCRWCGCLLDAAGLGIGVRGHVAWCPPSPFNMHYLVRTVPLDEQLHEIELRAHRRTLAEWDTYRRYQIDKMAQLYGLPPIQLGPIGRGILEQAGQLPWHEGSCTSCGLDDQPVRGLAGAELCRYCDELAVITTPKLPVISKPETLPARRRLPFLPSMALLIAGWVLILLLPGTWILTGMVLMFLGMLL